MAFLQIFTKLLKRHANGAYIDDRLLQSEIYKGFKHKIQDTMTLVDSVGVDKADDKK